jgi:hypothetical protein
VKRSQKPVQDKPYPFNLSQENRIVLTPKDYYKIAIEMVPSRIYLYVYETDMDYGYVSRLLPHEHSVETAVLIQNSSIINIPAGVNRWLQLTEHSQAISTTKTIHLFATPWRAKEIERDYQDIDHRLQSDILSKKERKILVKRLLSLIEARVNSRFNCFFYGHLSFQHNS